MQLIRILRSAYRGRGGECTDGNKVTSTVLDSRLMRPFLGDCKATNRGLKTRVRWE